MRRAIRIALLLLAVIATQASAQSIIERLITPGPLASGHARLESKCESCHSSFRKEAQNARCLSCHKGVAADISGRLRYHGKFAPARTQACKTCHSDHKGRGFDLIRLDRASFNHALTDYPLTGAHVKASCAACHGSGDNYRGITTVCASCHKRDEPHRGRLGRQCQTCHDSVAWKRTKPYNHAATGFALTGAHTRVACMSCHAGQRWAGTPATCISCHAADDAHRGSRGTNCASCHRTSAWRDASFDHDSTGFPLLGAHAAATCTGCHGPGNVNKHPTHACFGCHAKDDSHNGVNGTNCGSCHNSSSWGRVAFDHDRLTKFPLRGAHRGINCQSCHKRPAKEVKPPTTCFACHAEDDTHNGGNGQDCGRCHNEVSWSKVSFDHAKMTAFPLTGKHAQARCEACHTRPPSELPISSQCGACHGETDPHRGQLGANCGNCHDTVDWKANVRFDHGLTRFPLLGKHAGLGCITCHAERTFSAKGTSCASCHEDLHHNGALGQPAACASCHNSTDWKAWSFNHDVQTNFVLDGRHKGLICSACHSRPGNPAEQKGKCVDCHRRDDIHRGGFGDDCERCHVTSDFRAVRLRR